MLSHFEAVFRRYAMKRRLNHLNVPHEEELNGGAGNDDEDIEEDFTADWAVLSDDVEEMRRAVIERFPPDMRFSAEVQMTLLDAIDDLEAGDPGDLWEILSERLMIEFPDDLGNAVTPRQARSRAVRHARRWLREELAHLDPIGNPERSRAD